jgi:uncharacterized membrane protein
LKLRTRDDTNSRRIGLVAVGIVFLLSGLLMASQGAGYVGGSYMSGDPTYLYVGGVVAVIGLVVLALGLRSKKSAEPRPVTP